MKSAVSPSLITISNWWNMKMLSLTWLIEARICIPMVCLLYIIISNYTFNYSEYHWYTFNILLLWKFNFIFNSNRKSIYILYNSRIVFFKKKKKLNWNSTETIPRKKFLLFYLIGRWNDLMDDQRSEHKPGTIGYTITVDQQFLIKKSRFSCLFLFLLKRCLCKTSVIFF